MTLSCTATFSAPEMWMAARRAIAQSPPPSLGRPCGASVVKAAPVILSPLMVIFSTCGPVSARALPAPMMVINCSKCVPEKARSAGYWMCTPVHRYRRARQHKLKMAITENPAFTRRIDRWESCYRMQFASVMACATT